MKIPRLSRAGLLFGRVAVMLALLLMTGGRLLSAPASPPRPNVLVITVDALRADRLSSYGYARPTSPNLDRLLTQGVRFTRARVVEPLTTPGLCSMLTSLYPHQHGASRNGLRIRPGLISLPKILLAHGYRTGAFVGNWTLRDKLSGLGGHFEDYEEVLTRQRWRFLRSEATAEDLTGLSLQWIRDHLAARPRQPFLLWVHYVEPHAPYRRHKDFAERLGFGAQKKVSDQDRYDTEVAFVDHFIGELLGGLEKLSLSEKTLVVFASDHGESLGEHKYWGHGRNLYEPSLWIPMGIYWPGHLRSQKVTASALNLDLAPTVLRLLDLPVPESFEGYDWTGVLNGAAPPASRVTHYQAHRGAVISKHESDLARRKGLLAVALIDGSHKEILRVGRAARQLYDLNGDPAELKVLAIPGSEPTESLMSWMSKVYGGLTFMDADPPAPLDEESIEQLRSLGYVN